MFTIQWRGMLRSLHSHCSHSLSFSFLASLFPCMRFHSSLIVSGYLPTSLIPASLEKFYYLLNTWCVALLLYFMNTRRMQAIQQILGRKDLSQFLLLFIFSHCNRK